MSEEETPTAALTSADACEASEVHAIDAIEEAVTAAAVGGGLGGGGTGEPCGEGGGAAGTDRPGDRGERQSGVAGDGLRVRGASIGEASVESGEGVREKRAKRGFLESIRSEPKERKGKKGRERERGVYQRSKVSSQKQKEKKKRKAESTKERERRWKLREEKHTNSE